MENASKLLEDMIILTRNHDLDAIHVIEQLQQTLPAKFEPTLTELRNQLDYFDFNGATQTLENLIRDVQAPFGKDN